MPTHNGDYNSAGRALWCGYWGYSWRGRHGFGVVRMTLRIPSPDLAAALKGAAAIVETKNMLPILAMVKLEASDLGHLNVTTSNLDVEYFQSLSADVETGFSCCVDAKRFSAMASAASGDLSLSLSGNILTVKSGRSRWAVPAVPADDFPAMPVAGLCKPMALSPAVLVKRLLWAASTEMTRAYLSGIFMSQHEAKAHFVASNGYVMPAVQTSTKWPKGAPDIILAPGFLKALPDETGTLEWDEGKARFTAGNITVTGKSIEGQFPDFRRMWPEPCEPYAVDADELLGAVRRVRIASDAQQRKLRIHRQNGSLGIRIEGTSGFEGEATVDADCVEGFEAGLNADYLVGMLSALDAEAVTVEHSSPTTAMLLRPTAQSADMKFEGLVWPLRI